MRSLRNATSHNSTVFSFLTVVLTLAIALGITDLAWRRHKNPRCAHRARHSAGSPGG